MASHTTTIIFSGTGQTGNWSDAANWTGGVAPTSLLSIGVITTNATMNGNFTAGSIMALGQESVTINGALTTLSPALCSSFMVCDNAVVTFSPTSTLNDAGGLIVGADAAGTLVARGTGAAHAVLNSVDGKMGLFAGANGSITIDGAVWNNSQEMRVGAAGQGSLTVTNGGQVNVGGPLTIGTNAGSQGQVSLSNNAIMSVGSEATIGGGQDGSAGGPGAMTVSSGATFSVANLITVTSDGTLNVAGGTIAVANPSPGLQVSAGGTLSGNGTVSVATTPSHVSAGINDSGLVQATGGTLALNTSIFGTGALQIGAGSTLAINGSHIGVPTIAFTGSNGVLALATGVADSATITGFTAGDSIVMAGVDSMTWNSSTDVLTLDHGTTVVDKLHFAGTYASNAFTLTHTSAGAMIGLSTGHI